MKIYHPLLTLIASSLDSELAEYIQYLKQENKILRTRIPGQVHTTIAERETLLKFGKPIGRAIEELITIVTPKTFYRWVRDEKNGKPPVKNPKGGQRKPREVRELVIQVAKTTGFGYTRIIGELRKLGIRKISRQTVRNILKEEGIRPGPDRTSDAWKNFIQRHKETLWACDFFSVKTVTVRGLRDMYVLVWLCMTTREVVVSASTEHPNSKWMEEQVDRFASETEGREKKPEIVIHDRDTKFSKAFTQSLDKRGIQTNPLPKASPNLNGHCERVIRTIKNEALDYFVVFGEDHLNHIVSSFVEYYNTLRPHQGLEDVPLSGGVPTEQTSEVDPNEVACKEWLGGVLKHYERRAA